ncbi:MAG TPA: TadE family protein [Myxococcaceae bacterium]|nr:TadE family protein [Myxococcaceae bacterium]
MGTIPRPVPSRRGQATVELAIGLMLFVLLLVGGIHFGEMGMLAVKATEASSAALWDATGRLPHAYGRDGLAAYHDTVASRAQDRIGPQYEDFDGREDERGRSPSLVFTRASGLEVTCEVAGADVFTPMDLGTVDGIYFSANAQRGVRCTTTAEASILPGRTPQEFHTNTGWLTGPILKDTAVQFCGVGRAWGGSCNQGTPILIGEWALMNPISDEAGRCDVYDGEDCQNPGYYAAVKAYYDSPAGVPKGEDGSALAEAVSRRSSPSDEDAFYMSFHGSEDGYQQRLDGTWVGRRTFTVTPGGPDFLGMDQYHEMANTRSDCWLGLPCRRP